MTKLNPICVECFSGYKADEYPKYFYWRNCRFEIIEIMDRWHQGTSNPEFHVTNYFKVDTNCSQQFILKHDIESDEWYLCREYFG